MPGARAQAEQPPAPTTNSSRSGAYVAAPGAPPAAPSSVQPAPQIDTAEIIRRANKDVGVDIEATIAGWRRELDRLEGELRGPRLRYSQLNSFRDDLQRVRSEVEHLGNRLQPRLEATKAQVDLLGPAPAAGQPSEPDQVARNRAELDYHLGLLSAGRAAVNSAQLRIDQLIDSIQDIRRRNFTTNLFQPVPGIYSAEAWMQVPSTVPVATS
ncbi:MAG TPA: DUF3772 domain-containing protein, partial [Xanthobacteraceae bacterium]|nr:DUF3772 domain-containing protein [Xanthobacteraceae bacterium]